MAFAAQLVGPADFMAIVEGIGDAECYAPVVH